ncbi:MAG: substrate-binding domain-containing protein [Lachnospiraceae bacterium]|nr:substrate-binding domain-containing protein [Lachnospiraceae bacterium]
MKKKVLSAVVVVCMVALVLAACGNGGSGGGNGAGAENGGSGDGFTIGATVYYMTEFVTLMVNGIESRADELGMDLILLDANNNAQQQITQIENLIAQEVDVLLVAAVDSDAIVPALDMAEEAGIPLVGVNMLINTDRHYYYVGPDDVLAGQLQMQAAIDAIGGDGNVLILEGPIGQSAQIQRMEGNQKALAENPGINVLAHQTANWSRAEALALTENWLEAFRGEIDAIVAHNDEMALGAIQALEAAGLIGDIVVTGVDAILDGCNAVLDGTLLATVLQDAYKLGSLSVQLCYDVLMGNPPEEALNYIDMPLVTRDNVEQVLSDIYGQ